MGTLGNKPASGFQSIEKQTITGNGGTSYALDHAVTNVNDLEVFVNNVRQEPTTAYTLSGQNIVMSEAIANTDTFYVIYQSRSFTKAVPADTSVTSAMLNLTTLSVNKGSNGDIASFGNAGGTVGYVGTPFDDEMYIEAHGANSSGLLFTSGNQIQPRKNRAADDGNITLGNSGNRFKDIYLSGGTYVGGTGAANYLNDYEEGTYTPVWGTNSNSGSVGYSNQNGSYTKVGRLCRVWFDITISSCSGQSGTPTITLPFNTAASSSYDMGSFVPWDIDSNFSGGLHATQWTVAGTNVMLMYKWAGDANNGHTALNLNTTGRISGGVMYQTAS